MPSGRTQLLCASVSPLKVGCVYESVPSRGCRLGMGKPRAGSPQGQKLSLAGGLQSPGKPTREALFS